MGHAFHQLYYHFIWATHSRDPHIHPSFRPQLLEILNDEVKTRGGHPIRHNAMYDHVHLLVRLPPKVLVSEFIGQVKGATAFRVNRDLKPKFKLQWQEGYGALTLREDEIEKVSRYIDNQEEHHRTGRASQLLERIEPDEEPVVGSP
jgi:putative transposase